MMSRTGLVKVLSSLLLVAHLCGCAAAGDYARARGLDALDIVRIQGLAGLGVDVKGELTHFAGIGGGAYKAWAAGIGTRKVGVWKQVCVDFGVPWGPVLCEKRTLEGDEPDRRNDFSIFDLVDQEERPYEATIEGNGMQWLTARVCVFAFLGVDAELRVGEAFDFVVGIVGLDPAKDDAAVEA